MQFPMHFEVEGNSPPGMQTLWSARCGDLPPLTCAIPKEFRGPGGGYSPEDLLGLAALNCLIATFKVFSEVAALKFEKISGKVTVVIDRPQGKPVGITRLHISLTVSNPSDREKALKLLEESRKNCLVTQALSIEKEYDLQVE